MLSTRLQHRRPRPAAAQPHIPLPDGMWGQWTRRTSALPSSIGGRTRAGSSGASGAADAGPHSPTLSATGRLRWRGRRAPRSCHLRLSLDPGSPNPAEAPPELPSAFSPGPIPQAGLVVSRRTSIKEKDQSDSSKACRLARIHVQTYAGISRDLQCIRKPSATHMQIIEYMHCVSGNMHYIVICMV